jgi:hypothetical protein
MMRFFSMIARLFKRKQVVVSPTDTPIYDDLLREFQKRNPDFMLGA